MFRYISVYMCVDTSCFLEIRRYIRKAVVDEYIVCTAQLYW